MYVIDTNVVSITTPTHGGPTSALGEWMDRHSRSLFLSVVTVAEIEAGIAKTRRQGATRKAERLTIWLDALLHLYGDRILPLDVATARLIGGFSDGARAAGGAPEFADLAIAATAASRGFVVLTRNLRHFRAFGVTSHDPFANLPATPS